MDYLGSKIRQDTGEIYTTRNFLISRLSARLTDKISILLNTLKANQLVGLDIGCAEGYLLAELKKQKAIDTILAIDFEYDKLTSNIAKTSGCQFVQCDAMHLGFLDNSFDYVMATEILEHLPHPQKCLLEICRVAKQGAPVIISVPYEPYFHIGNLLRGKHLKRGGKTPSHLHFWHRKEFVSLLGSYLEIQEEFKIATFPWQLYLCLNR